jgi:Tfp pilus assembly protein PilF
VEKDLEKKKDTGTAFFILYQLMCIYYLKQKEFDEAQKKYKKALERGKKKK